MRYESYTALAEEELSLTLQHEECGERFWDTAAYAPLSEILAAIAEHDKECKGRDATES